MPTCVCVCVQLRRVFTALLWHSASWACDFFFSSEGSNAAVAPDREAGNNHRKDEAKNTSRDIVHQKSGLIVTPSFGLHAAVRHARPTNTCSCKICHYMSHILYLFQFAVNMGINRLRRWIMKNEVEKIPQSFATSHLSVSCKPFCMFWWHVEELGFCLATACRWSKSFKTISWRRSVAASLHTWDEMWMPRALWPAGPWGLQPTGGSVWSTTFIEFQHIQHTVFSAEHY